MSLKLPKPVEGALRHVASELEGLLQGISMPSRLKESTMHYLLHRGKMIRPMLALYTAYMLSNDPTPAIYPAVSIELLHVASLLQDDIIDGHVVRRGVETPFKRFGTEYAMLASDMLIAKAVEYALKAKTKSVALELTNAALRLTIGQSYELEYRLSGEISLDRYLKIVENKTASLISSSMVVGGYVSDADDQLIARLRRLGRILGVAYQIRDDLIDYLKLDEENPQGLRSVDVNIVDVLKADGSEEPVIDAVKILEKYLNDARVEAQALNWGLLNEFVEYLGDVVRLVKEKE